MTRISRLLAIGTLLSFGLTSASAPARTEPSDAFMKKVPSTWRAPQPSLVERLTAIGGAQLDRPTLEALQRDALLASADGAAVAQPEFVYPTRAGDLDGDGKNDVITVEFIGEQPNLFARRGLDGSVLWNAPRTHFALPGDLDANGETDILLLENNWSTIDPGVSTVAQRLSLRRRDGSVGWEWTFRAMSIRRSPAEIFLASDSEWVVDVTPISDATGDGKPDLWVGTARFAQTDTGGFNEGRTFTGHTLDGQSGMPFGSITTHALNGMPWAIPAGDVNGDGLSDVFAITRIDTDRLLVSAQSSHGVVYWTAEAGANGADMTAADFSGDGLPDLMLQAFASTTSLRLGYSGADGALLFERPDAGYIQPAGDVDGDGGVDLIELDTADTSNLATAWSGKTGEIIYAHSFAGPDGAWAVFCTCVGDVSGDGIWDPLSAEVEFTDPVRMTVRTLDGVSGLPLWQTEMPGSDGFPGYLGADVDADGAEDIAITPTDGAVVRVRTLRGIDASPIWTMVTAMEAFSIGAYGDDVAGDGEPEILMAAVAFGEESFLGSAHVFDRHGRVWRSH